MRRGLVLGAGGVLGGAWTIGALCALEDAGFDPRTADVIIGTSAGSVLGALLAAGVSASDLRAHQQGRPIPTGPLAEQGFDYDGATGGALPGRPRLRIGSRRLLVHSARHLLQTSPTVVVAALVPPGRGSLERIGEMIGLVTPAGSWSPHPQLWVVAMDYDTGRRVPFGRPDSPPTDLASAVLASCAIPGWFAPVTIDGHRYVDGGAYSEHSVDLLAGMDLDEVYVLAPMAASGYDHPASVAARLERSWRRRVGRRLEREVRAVRKQGTQVRVLAPGPEDLKVIGANVMETARRLDVLATSLRTSAAALLDPPAAPVADPEPVPNPSPAPDDLASTG